MHIPQIDRSNYLKGLLITAKKDKQLAESERKIIKKLSERLGFSNDFFEETISSLLENKYITEEPITFSNKSIAASFLEDGLKLALSDDVITENEINWLKETAAANNIEADWFDKKFNELKGKPNLFGKMDFALYSLI
jgi:hypothetical protein